MTDWLPDLPDFDAEKRAVHDVRKRRAREKRARWGIHTRASIGMSLCVASIGGVAAFRGLLDDPLPAVASPGLLVGAVVVGSLVWPAVLVSILHLVRGALGRSFPVFPWGIAMGLALHFVLTCFSLARGAF